MLQRYSSFIIHFKTGDFYKDIADDVKKWFDASNYEDNKRPFPRGMNKKVIELMKDELGEKILKEFVAIRPKTYLHLADDDSNVKKANKMCDKKNT